MCNMAFWTTFILGLIGASAWLAPYIYNKLAKPTLKGRLVSHHQNSGQFNGRRCIMYFLALNVISLNRSFNIKNTQITVRYKNASDKYTGNLFWARKNEWTGANGERLILSVLPENTLPFVGTIPQDLTKKIYMTFYVDKAELEEFAEIVIEFNEESGCKSTIVIDGKSIDGEQMLWDDRIWIPT